MKNSKLLAILQQLTLVGVCTLSLSPAFAALPQNGTVSNDKAALAGTPCASPEDCLAEGYGVSLRSILFLPPYKQSNSMVAGSILNIILTPPPAASLSMNSNLSQSIMTLIANNGDVTDKLLASTPEIFAPGIVLIPQVTQNISEAQQQSALNTLNFESVIAPTLYNKISAGNNQKDQIDQSMIANTFIQYVTGLANPMRPSNFASAKLPSDGSYTSLPAYLADFQKKPEVAAYLAALRTYTAQLSVGLSNFYYLYNERMPIKNKEVLDKALALTKQPGPNSPEAQGALSPLQVEQILATRRVNDPGWYIAMQNAVPSTLLREILFQLAEIPPMLFQLHLDLERLLATMSAVEVQQANGSVLALEQQRDKVDNLLQNPAQTQSQTSQAVSNASSAVDDAELQAAKNAVKSNNSQ